MLVKVEGVVLIKVGGGVLVVKGYCGLNSLEVVVLKDVVLDVLVLEDVVSVEVMDVLL